MSTIVTFLLAAAAAALAVVGIVVLIAVGCVRAVRRAVMRRLRGHRPVTASPLLPGTAAGVLLAARAWTPGPQRQATALRRDLQRDLAGALRAVEAGHAAGRPVGSLRQLGRQVAAEAAQLDVDLAVLATEPDPRTRAGLLAATDERVRLLRRSCTQLREGVLLTATTGPRLAPLCAELDDEVQRLRLCAQAHQQLVQGSGRTTS